MSKNVPEYSGNDTLREMVECTIPEPADGQLRRTANMWDRIFDKLSE